MEKANYQKVFSNVKHHASIMARGFARTLYGAAVAGLILVAGYGFVVIKSETGYAAVCDFIAAAATMAVALCNMYVMGRKKHAKRGKSNANS